MSAPRPHAEYLTAKQVAERFQASTATVYSLAESGQLPAINIGTGTKRRALRFLASDVDAFLLRSKVVPPVVSMRAVRAVRGELDCLRAAGYRG